VIGNADVERLFDRYGYDDTYSAGWAAWYGPVERLLTLVRLQAEKRRRASGDWSPTVWSPVERLWWLRFERWWRRVVADAQRQERACEALGVPFPLVGSAMRAGERPEDALGKAAVIAEARERALTLVPVNHAMPRPWVWCHEDQAGRSELLPVVYAYDWDPETHPDRYGFADRWSPGETVVVPVEELPVDAVVVSSPVRPVAPRALPEAVEDAEVVDGPGASTAEAPADEPRERRRSSSGSGVVRWYPIDPSTGIVGWGDPL